MFWGALRFSYNSSGFVRSGICCHGVRGVCGLYRSGLQFGHIVFGFACAAEGRDFVRFMSHSCRCLFVGPSLQASGLKPRLAVYRPPSGSCSDWLEHTIRLQQCSSPTGGKSTHMVTMIIYGRATFLSANTFVPAIGSQYPRVRTSMYIRL